jgi:hypothetical protein
MSMMDTERKTYLASVDFGLRARSLEPEGGSMEEEYGCMGRELSTQLG